MSFLCNGKVGANAQHIKDAAVASKGLATLISDSPEELLKYYIRHEMLPKNANIQDAINLKQQRIKAELDNTRASKRAFLTTFGQDTTLKGSLRTAAEQRNYLQQICKYKSPQEILTGLGIQTQVLPGGTKELSQYIWTPKAFSFKEAGIDERKLLEGVESIKGTCDLAGSYLTDLGGVKSVGELVIPQFGQLKDLSGLKNIGTIKVDGDLTMDQIKAFLTKLNIDPDVLKRAKISTWF